MVFVTATFVIYINLSVAATLKDMQGWNFARHTFDYIYHEYGNPKLHWVTADVVTYYYCEARVKDNAYHSTFRKTACRGYVHTFTANDV